MVNEDGKNGPGGEKEHGKKRGRGVVEGLTTEMGVHRMIKIGRRGRS